MEGSPQQPPEPPQQPEQPQQPEPPQEQQGGTITGDPGGLHSADDEE